MVWDQGVYYTSIIIQKVQKLVQSMNTLYPKDFIPFKISTSSDEIDISLGISDPKVMQDYKQSVKPDIVVQFNSKPYELHVLVVEQHSDIFWKGLIRKEGDMYYFDTKQCGNQLLFQKIISCIYGSTISIRRYDVQQFYRLAKILYLSQLQDILQKDMLDNFQEYDIFPLLKFATEQKILNVMAFCYETLELEHFQPIRYNKSGLFLCQPQLFRTIIKRHNYMKKEYSGLKFGLSEFEIQKLVEEYCYVNGIKGRRREKFMADVENKQNCNYFFISKPNIDIFTTQRRINTCINLPSLTSLRDIGQPEQDDENFNKLMKSNKKNKISKMVSFANDSCSIGDQNKQSCQLSPISPSKVKKQRSIDQISLLSFSPTYRKRKSNSPLRRLNRQFSQISDPETMIVITNLSQSLKDSLKSSSQIEKKAEQMMASLKLSVKRSKDRTSKIQKMQGQLDEIYAEILSSQTRLEQVQKTVTLIQEQSKQTSKKQKKHKKFFQTSIALDLSISKEFGKNTLKSPQLSRR